MALAQKFIKPPLEYETVHVESREGFDFGADEEMEANWTPPY